MRLERFFLVVLALVFFFEGAAADDAMDRRTAMAVETVVLAEGLCGYELTIEAEDLIAGDREHAARRFGDDRAVLANLWRQTFACNAEFAGENCFAARWQLCQRAYAEYGPQGIRLKGMIKAVVKK